MDKPNNYLLDIVNKGIKNNCSFINSVVYKLYLKLTYNHIIWILFHSFTVNFDEKLLENKIFNKNLKYLIENFAIFKFKCIRNCGNSYNEYLNNYNLSVDKIIESKYNLIIFFMNYHNYVNEKINKANNYLNVYNNNKYIYNYDEVIKLYTNNDFINYFNKYEINVTNFLLEENPSLTNLIDKIYDKIEKKYSEELILELCLKNK